MRHLGSLRFSFAILAFLVVLADCGGGGGGGGGIGGVLPSTGGGSGTKTLSTGSSNPYTSATGQIASLVSGGFTLQQSDGTVTVYTNKSKNNYGPKAAVGVYAMVVGTPGSSNSINAIAVSTGSNQFGTVTVSGPVSGWDVTDGFTIQGGPQIGYINIFMLPSTTVNGSATIHVGEVITATGVGSLATQLAASSISVVSSSPSPTPTTTPSATPVTTAPPTPTPVSTPTPAPTPTSLPTAGTTISMPAGVSTWAGPFVGYIKGGFEIHPPNGYTNIYTNSDTVINGTLGAGTYVQATGTGNPYTKIQGIYVTVYSGQPSTTQLGGSVAASTSYGFTLNTGSENSSVPVILNSSTLVAGGRLAVGSNVEVKGIGSSSASVVAAQIVVSDPTPPPTPTPGPISETHVMTMDFLGAPWGSATVGAAAAAPFLSWAETGPSSSLAIHATGIHTQLYVDPNRTLPSSPMYGSTEAEFAHDCNGNRVTTSLSGQTLYVMDVTSSALQSQFQQVTGSTGGTYDAVYEDDAGPLSAFTEYATFSAMPCNYSDSEWIAGGEALNATSSLPVIFNGLADTGTQTVAPSIQFLSGSNTLGGARESCYTSTGIAKEDGALWASVEDTEIDVASQHKIFECFANGPGTSGSETDSRLYVYASFLLTYDPNTSMLWERYSTPSGFDVNPETGLVALDPVISEPSNVSTLQQPGGSYARQYGQCYLRGQFVGPCAVVVNPNNGLSPIFPFPQYTHTLVLNGSDVMDGGTVSTNGPPPPEYLGPDEAVIVFP